MPHRYRPFEFSAPVAAGRYPSVSGAIGACPSAEKEVHCRGAEVRDFKDCVPADARAYYTELFKQRTTAERSKYDVKLLAIRNALAAQGVRSSGHADKASWDTRADFLDALAIGYVEDVLEVYKERELALTQAVCSCIVDTAYGFLDTVYRQQLKLSAEGMLGFRLLNSCIQEMGTRKFSAMPRITILVEKARLASVKKKSESPINVTINNSNIQNITGSHNNVTMTGNVAAQQQYTVNDFNQLAVELESLRHAFGTQPTGICVEDLSLLEEAEKAAKRRDQATLQRCAKTISKGTWEFAKSAGVEIGKQALIGFLKSHGIPLP